MGLFQIEAIVIIKVAEIIRMEMAKNASIGLSGPL